MVERASSAIMSKNLSAGVFGTRYFLFGVCQRLMYCSRAGRDIMKRQLLPRLAAVTVASLLFQPELSLASQPVRNHPASIFLFSAPGSKHNVVFSINASGTVVGACYQGPCGGRHHPGKGFIRAIDGTLSTFAVANVRDTIPAAINDAGRVIGYYTAKDYHDHGFFRDADGSITKFDASGGSGSTYPSAINNLGVIAGSFYDDVGPHGFIRATDGTFTTFNSPGSSQTFVDGMNSEGTIAGTYEDATGNWHGYLRSADGSFTTIDVTGAINIGLLKINDKGVISGSWEDSTTHWHGFMRAADGTITEIDYPNALLTEAEDISAHGEIVGYYIDQNVLQHGFSRSPKGKFRSITASQHRSTTEATCINSSGLIAGNYGGRHWSVGGFVQSP